MTHDDTAGLESGDRDGDAPTDKTALRVRYEAFGFRVPAPGRVRVENAIYGGLTLALRPAAEQCAAAFDAVVSSVPQSGHSQPSTSPSTSPDRRRVRRRRRADRPFRYYRGSPRVRPARPRRASGRRRPRDRLGADRGPPGRSRRGDARRTPRYARRPGRRRSDSRPTPLTAGRTSSIPVLDVASTVIADRRPQRDGPARCDHPLTCRSGGCLSAVKRPKTDLRGWVRADLNCRPPPCQGGVITCLDHEPGLVHVRWPSPQLNLSERTLGGALLRVCSAL